VNHLSRIQHAHQEKRAPKNPACFHDRIIAQLEAIDNDGLNAGNAGFR